MKLESLMEVILPGTVIKPGMIVRQVLSTINHINPFADAVVLKVSDDSYTLARPYAYGSLLETICPTVLTGVEKYTVTDSALRKNYRLVLRGNGEPAIYSY